MPDVAEHVLDHVSKNLSVSMKQTVIESHIAQITIWRVMHEHEHDVNIPFTASPES
jgi:hypothetical protein